jgi:hypothetical protein
MRKWFRAATLLCISLVPAFGQSGAYKVPRMADGHPNLNGIWQAVNSANWNLQDHPAYAGPMWEMGAIAAVSAGRGVVEGNDIPYKPEAAAKRLANFKPYPFQIVQTNRDILFVYEYATSNRLVNMGKPMEAGSDTWMGTNNGHWEGETLVIDVTGLNGLAWFDRAGNFASDKLHIVERFTRTSPDHLTYQATIEDPSVFTKPWKISMPLYRRVEKDAQLLEFKCTEFAEELLYGKFKKTGKEGAK